MIINFIERYFYIICFATYTRGNAKEGFKKSFVQWMDEHSDLRSMVENGKDKLEWYRKVDENKISSLKGMIEGPEYREKLQHRGRPLQARLPDLQRHPQGTNQG